MVRMSGNRRDGFEQGQVVFRVCAALLISEIFASIQGEGQFTGTPSVFVRLSGCNLRCHFCDTPYASWQPEGTDMSVSQILEAVGQWWHPHVVITGGEPLLFKELPELTEALKLQDRFLTIETAGTVFQDIQADLMSISPKRRNSTPWQSSEWAQRHEQRRHQPGVIRQLSESYECQYKFVIDQPDDVADVLQYLEEFPEIERTSVWLMPQAIMPDVLTEKLIWLQPLALEHGFHLATRLQIQQFGNRRGT